MPLIHVTDPGFTLELPQDDSTTATIAAHPWLKPRYVNAANEVVVCSGAFVHSSEGTVDAPAGTVCVIDPFLVFNDSEGHQRRIDALPVAASDVDFVVHSHVQGDGDNATPDGDLAFPNATYVLAESELDDVKIGRHPDASSWLTAHREGRVRTVNAGDVVTDGVSMIDLPGHSRQHLGIAIGNPIEAIICGHLFLHPAQVADPDAQPDAVDPEALLGTRHDLLSRCADDGIALLGHLFPSPGGGVVKRTEDGGFRLD